MMVDRQEAHRFPVPKPKVELAAAEKQFLAHLGEAMKLISEGGLKTREGIMESIEAVICFLHDRGVSGQQIWPFGYLRQELDALFQGKRSPILQPGISSRDDILAIRYSGPAKEQVRNFAAACSEAVYRLGRCATLDGFPKRTRGDTDRFVAGKVTKWPSFDLGACSQSAIKSWRDKFGKQEQVQLLVASFVRDGNGREELNQVLRRGPPHIGGF